MNLCPHCKKEFPKGKSFGAHVTNCKLNPKRKEIQDKIIKTKKSKWKEFKVKCYKCGKEITINEWNTNKPKKEKYFCSRSCANSRGPRSKDFKEKVRKKLLKEPEEKICPYCKKIFLTKSKRQIHCSRSCSAKNVSLETRKKISEQMKGLNSGKNNGMYGKSPSHTKRILVFSNKHTKKKTFYVRSSYEKIFVDQINENNFIKKFTYEPKNFRVSYKDENGLERTYQPDFLVNKKIVEIKNKWNAELEETKIKERAFKKTFPNTKYTIIKW